MQRKIDNEIAYRTSLLISFDCFFFLLYLLFIFFLFYHVFLSLVYLALDFQTNRILDTTKYFVDSSTRNKRQPKYDYAITWNNYSGFIGVKTEEVIHVGERNMRAMNSTSQM